MDIQTIVAAAVFAAAIILLIGMMKNKLLHGGSCCGGHEVPESKVKVADKNISHYDYHYEVSIEGMVCSNCATRVENALNGNEGIYAKIDLGNKKAVIHAKRALSKEEVLGYRGKEIFKPLNTGWIYSLFQMHKVMPSLEQFL